MVRGYARISKSTQQINRQITNILREYPDAKIYQEAYTGTKVEGRKVFKRLLEELQSGDVLVFDSVSRMSRDAEKGIEVYFDLFKRGIKLVFLKEPYINTETYANEIEDKIELQGTDEDEIFKGLNNYFRKLAERQIRIAFWQAAKEVIDLQIRTKEGIREARKKNKQIGSVKGAKYNIKKEQPAKDIIRKHCREFGGSLTDKEVIRICGICQNTFYKYKREIREEYIQ